MTTSPIRTREVAVLGRSGDATCDTVASFLTQLGLVPAVMSPQGQAGGDAAALDALEVLRDIEFAVVLQDEHPLEIGFLLGALGRKRVFFLAGKLAKYPLDDGGVWRLLVARDLKQAGFEIDLNRAI
jgi:hypothetical protein